MNLIRVLLFAACFKQLAKRYPSLFDGRRALREILLAIEAESELDRVNVSDATEAYAAYLNTPRNILEPDEQELWDEDLDKARKAMEVAWLNHTAKP